MYRPSTNEEDYSAVTEARRASAADRKMSIRLRWLHPSAMMLASREQREPTCRHHSVPLMSLAAADQLAFSMYCAAGSRVG